MAIRSILPLTVSGPVTVAHPGSWQTGDTASLYVGDNNSGLTSTFGGPVNVFGYNGVNIAVQKTTQLSANSSGVAIKCKGSYGAQGQLLTSTGNGCQWTPGAVRQGTPSSSSAPCTPPMMMYDANYIYICVTPDRWKRAAMNSF